MNFHSLAFWYEHPLHADKGAPRPRIFAAVAPLAIGVALAGPSPAYAGSGFLPGRDFWRLGAIFGLYYLLVFLAVGLPTLLFLV